MRAKRYRTSRKMELRNMAERPPLLSVLVQEFEEPDFSRCFALMETLETNKDAPRLKQRKREAA